MCVCVCVCVCSPVCQKRLNFVEKLVMSVYAWACFYMAMDVSGNSVVVGTQCGRYVQKAKLSFKMNSLFKLFVDTRMHMHVHEHPHPHTPPYTHTHTCVHAHTHTHTHTYIS